MRCTTLLVVLGACGGGDPATTPDAPGPDAGYDTARCLIQGHYGDLGRIAGTTSQGPTTLTVTLDAGPPRDSLFIKLEAGQGVFTGGLATGTFPISGADASFNTCGLCVNIIADITANGPQKFYFAQSGTVTLTSTSPPAGTLADIQLVEIDIAPGTPTPDGCDASITAAQFVAQ